MNSNSGIWRRKGAGERWRAAAIAMGLKLSPRSFDLLTIAAIAVAYFVSGKLAFALVNLDSLSQVPILYPPIGIAMGILLLLNRRAAWVGVTLGAFWLARFLPGATWLTAIGTALSSTIQVFVAQRLLNRLKFERSLRRVRDVSAFVAVAAVLSPLINATIRTISAVSLGIIPITEAMNYALVIGLGDAIAILILTPAILVWGTRPVKVWMLVSSFKSIWQQNLSFRRRVCEVAIWFGLVIACSWLSLTVSLLSIPTGWHGAAGTAVQYLPFLLIVWAALRMGQRGTVLSLLLISGLAIVAVTHAYHQPELLLREELQHVLFHLQTFLSVMATVALVLAAAIAERQEVERILRRQIRQDQLLAEGILRIRQSLDIEEVLNTTVAEVRQFFNADRVHIGVFDAEGYTDVLAESVAPGWRALLHTRSPRPVLADIQAVFADSSIRVNSDTEAIEKNEFLKMYYAMYQVRASLAVPIFQEGRYFGVLNVHQCSAPRQWQLHETELLKRLALQLELAIQQGNLYQQVQNAANNLEQQIQERTIQLQQNMQQLQKLNEVKDTLLHAVTHDLRTPTIGMLMVLKKLRDRSEDTQVVMPRSTLERMIESGDRQLSLIRSLLEDSTESSEITLAYQSILFQDLLQDVLQTLEPLLSQNRAVLNNLVPADLPPIAADPMHLRRVLENLLTNALNHNTPEVEIAIAAEVSDQKLHCTIADNGVGMTQEQCDQLFKKPFLRGSHNHHRTGLGLGLFLCHQIVTAHGGEIWVSSAPNAGATFWFTIPSGH